MAAVPKHAPIPVHPAETSLHDGCGAAMLFPGAALAGDMHDGAAAGLFSSGAVAAEDGIPLAPSGA